MALTARCPNAGCDARFSVEPEQLGRTAKCPRCGTRFTLSADTDPGIGDHDPGPGVPRAIGRYRVGRRLGRGGMGSVYLAHDDRLDRPVAIKVPDPALALDPDFLERFRREARAAATFRHPNFCPVHEVGQDGNSPFLVMAYIEGKPLADLVADGPSPPREAARLVRELARALAEAHRRGIVHRDLKPANVMVDQAGTLIVMDFGLARRVLGDEPELTRTGAALGTPSYMSPEQVHGERAAIGPATDIYALGVILYELLAGRRPFQGTVSQVFVQIATAPPVPPSEHVAGLDPALEAICLDAMAKEPADRPPSADAMADRLGAWIDGVDHGLTAVTEGEGGEGPGGGRPSRRGLIVAGASAVGLAAVGGLAMAFGRLGKDRGQGGGGERMPAPEDTTTASPFPWALDFDGNGFARTDYRYDGGPLQLEAVVDIRRRGPANVLGNLVLIPPRGERPGSSRGLALGVARGGFWAMLAGGPDGHWAGTGRHAGYDDTWVRLQAWYVPQRRRIGVAVDGEPGTPVEVGELGIIDAMFLIGAGYLATGPRMSEPAPNFVGRVAWVHIAIGPRPWGGRSLDLPEAGADTQLLLDFTRGPDDPAIQRAQAEGRVTLEGARFVRLDEDGGGKPAS